MALSGRGGGGGGGLKETAAKNQLFQTEAEKGSCSNRPFEESDVLSEPLHVIQQIKIGKPEYDQSFFFQLLRAKHQSVWDFSKLKGTLCSTPQSFNFIILDSLSLSLSLSLLV